MPKFLDTIKEKLRSLPTSMSNRAVGINWHKISQFLFSPLYRTPIHRIFLFSLVLSLIYSSASTLVLFFDFLLPTTQVIQTPHLFVPNAEKFQQKLSSLGTNPLFITGPGKNAQNGGKSKINAESLGPCLLAKEKSSLPIKLFGTIVMQENSKSLASVQIQNQQEPKNIYEGESLQGLAKVGKIQAAKLIIRNLDNLKCEYILDQNASSFREKDFNILSPKDGKALLQKNISGVDNEGNSFRIKRSFFNEKLKDINNIINQANSIAVNNPDGTVSIKVTDIEPGSIFSYLGIENNDKISEINGKPIKDTMEVMNLFGQLKSISKLQLKVVKGDGEEKVLDYGFTP